MGYRTLTLTSVSGNSSLAGTDGQCGATKKAGASGIGVFNPDGTVGLNFTIVLPGGRSPARPGAGGLQGAKEVDFTFVTVPGGGTIIQLTSLTFVAPVTGVAILESRGYCNIVEAATNVELDIAAGVDATVAFNAAPSVNPVSHWGILQVPAGTSKAHQRMWTTRNTFPVAAGTSYARGLFARHQFGAQNGNCGGTFAVSFAGGTLP